MSELPRYEYVKLADTIEADIASGELPQGAALPGERAMTELYSVSIGTVRRTIVEPPQTGTGRDPAREGDVRHRHAEATRRRERTPSDMTRRAPSSSACELGAFV
ncbi:GntR family transcriptional regulator [Streptomyces sp. NPDC102365]|uniref:GntR family transcriptional regulator n=1 Tax=Streptomyces sp. NPDC102365 TaxID=3366162 RepID=UPI00381AABA0